MKINWLIIITLTLIIGFQAKNVLSDTTIKKELIAVKTDQPPHH